MEHATEFSSLEKAAGAREKVNPLQYKTDLKEIKGNYSASCACPCPEISAPIWMAGAVIFDPLE